MKGGSGVAWFAGMYFIGSRITGERCKGAV